MGNPIFQEEFDNYKKRAAVLARHSIVTDLVQDINNTFQIDECNLRPFFYIASSSGTGKTQMAFNLMEAAKDQFKVIYLLGTGPGDNDQEIYKGFSKISGIFNHLCQEEFKIFSTTGNLDAANLSTIPLSIFALLNKLQKFDFYNRKEDVIGFNPIEKITGDKVFPRGHKVVIILDEFPKIQDNENYLRFMRNVLRATNSVVILMGTNSSGGNMLRSSEKSRDSKNVYGSWCQFITRLPPVSKQSLSLSSSLPKVIQNIILRSRPLLAHYAAVYSRMHPFNSHNIKAYLSDICKYCYKEISDRKKFSSVEHGLLGQYLLFQNYCYSDQITKMKNENISDTHSLINSHMAVLTEETPFCLSIAVNLDGTSSLFKVNEKNMKNIGRKSNQNLKLDINPFKCIIKFPNIGEDMLLYLCCMGGLNYHPFPNERSLAQVRDILILKFPSIKTFEQNKVQISNDGMKLESLSAASIVLSSHLAGFDGVNFLLLLQGIVQQFTSKNCSLSYHPNASDLKSFLASLTVPFLPPPNAEWPQEFHALFGSLGKLERTTNNERIDGRVSINGGNNILFTWECKDLSQAISSSIICNCIERVPQRTNVHVLFTTELQGSYDAAINNKTNNDKINERNFEIYRLKRSGADFQLQLFDVLAETYAKSTSNDFFRVIVLESKEFTSGQQLAVK